MRALESGGAKSERETLMDDLIAHISALFARLPTLSGFSVQAASTLPADREAVPLDDELSITEVSVDTWPGVPQTPLGKEIAGALVELLEEDPAARGLLGGYTFARTFH